MLGLPDLVVKIKEGMQEEQELFHSVIKWIHSIKLNSCASR